MLTYTLSDAGPEAMYEQLYQFIRKDILTGHLKPGDKLPSKRNFAKNLGVSTITVETAYEQLMSEGYLYSLPKKGYYVAELKNIIPVKQRPEPVVLEEEPVETEMELLADFTSNETSSEVFPFSTWAKLIREILNDNQIDLMTSPKSGGILELRQAIAKHLLAFRGMEVQPGQIIIGAGTEYLYGLLIQLLGADKKYGVEEPGYEKIALIYGSHNVACSHIPMDQAGIMINRLEELRTDVVHISPSHHFPTGRVMPIGRRYELLGWAAESDSRYIIEDDYDSEFRLTGQPIPSLKSIDVMEKVIYINTFSKTLSSTVRISYMVLPPHLVQEFYRRLDFYSCTVSNFEQYTLAEFIKRGYFEKHINRMRNYYVKKRNALVHGIMNSSLGKIGKIMEEDAGLHFVLALNTSLSDEMVQRRALERGIRIKAMSNYYQKEKRKDTHTFVMNYTSIKEGDIPEILARLWECLNFK